jgi:aryl-alcohol dehydrogenase-like predicted oxidoreductase
MEYCQLDPATRISRIGFGSMSLKAGNPEAKAIIDAAIDGGINLFDTADLYEQGANEEQLGLLLKPHRNRVLIATKVGNQWRKDGSGWDWNPTKAYILQAVEDSLRRLQIDTIDLYQLHGGTIQDNIDETIEAFEILRSAGKIRYYGISSIRPNVIRSYVEKSRISTVMMQYSALDRRPEESCLPLLKEHGIPVLARGTVASGLLIDKPAKEYLGHPAETVETVRETIKLIAAKYGLAPGSVAIRFALKNTAIGSAIVGIRTMHQLEEALTAVREVLPDEAYNELYRQLPRLNYTDHR